jgi:predicted ester cyclase
MTVEANIRQGDTEAIRWSARMTHAGDHLGMPASNKPVILTGMTFAWIVDGKVVEAWDNWDMLGLLNQIGALDRSHIVPPG